MLVQTHIGRVNLKGLTLTSRSQYRIVAYIVEILNFTTDRRTDISLRVSHQDVYTRTVSLYVERTSCNESNRDGIVEVCSVLVREESCDKILVIETATGI